MTHAVVLLLWVVALSRWNAWRQARGFINASFAACFTLVAVAVTIDAHEIAVDRATGPYVADLLEHIVMVISALAAQLFLLALRNGRPVRREVRLRSALGAVVVLVIFVTFIVSPIHSRYIGDLDDFYAQLPAIAVQRLVYVSYLGYALVDVVRLSRRYASTPGDIVRIMNGWLVGAGAVIACLFPASRLVYIVVDTTTGHRPDVLLSAGSIAALVGMCSVACGVMLPRVSAVITRWSTAVSGLRRLQPLWRDLIDTFPTVALPTNAPVSLRRAELRYARHLVEVAEGLAQAHVDMPPGELKELDSNATAQLLYARRGHWAEGAGQTAGTLLPAVETTEDEHRQILALADAYRIARTRITDPTVGVRP
jgi:hypothetical protein